jgi:hypothetical protein
MRDKLYQRRRRTLVLLATSNSLTSIAASISDEFKCSEDAVYKDINNVGRWGEDFTKTEYNQSVIAGKLSILYRDAIDSMLSSKEEKFKHQARADALSILKEQINLGDQLGALGGQPQEVSQTLSVRLPFEANTDIMAAYRGSVEKQKAEKDSQVKSNAECEGKNEGDIKRETDEKPVA